MADRFLAPVYAAIIRSAMVGTALPVARSAGGLVQLRRGRSARMEPMVLWRRDTDFARRYRRFGLRGAPASGSTY
ncbi:hypothetical protein B5K05_22110 [Rhizobium phaseoli]|nr:hypothetical protein AMC87_PD00534 [Rhizobium phaseoli]ARM16527.1 hypothetical protein Bra5_PD00988 [Rhizobium phaseoli Brasil 5]KKZ83826.1 hypothetical protein RPHASCH2410_PD02710 [Rhizobium phaseoli Ch24-10]PDS31739.1 hypothetical protein CO650_09140 [Rhizobium phaseoli]RDJ05393.1 hypothetical protein B5K04_22050 [Rhizobium phaseoli]